MHGPGENAESGADEGRNMGQKVAAAIELQQSGRLGEAEAVCREILETEPSHAEAQHLPGLSAWQRGDTQAALSFIDAAIRSHPNAAAYHFRCGNALQNLGYSCGARSDDVTAELRSGCAGWRLVMGLSDWVARDAAGCAERHCRNGEWSIRVNPGEHGGVARTAGGHARSGDMSATCLENGELGGRP